MFARIIEFVPKAEKKDEFIRTLKNEILPILKKQPGFLEILPLYPESSAEKMLTFTLWTDKKSAERYGNEVFPNVESIMKPYVTGTVVWKHYAVETTVCKHLVEALVA